MMYRELLCDEAPEPAPRSGCACRQCYRRREMSLDPALIAIVRENYDRPMSLAPSRMVVHRCLDHYLAGRVEWGALHLGIIKALAELADKQHEQLMTVVNSRPTPPSLMIPRCEPFTGRSD